MDIISQMAKALGDQVDASREYLSQNKDYSGVVSFPNYVG